MQQRFVRLLVFLLMSLLLSTVLVVQALSTFSAPFNGIGTWVYTGSIQYPRIDFGASTLQDGSVLIAGGGSSGWRVAIPYSEIYDPATGKWHITGNMKTPRNRLNLITLDNGKVLAPAGTLSSDLASADTNIVELYNPLTETWDYTASLNTSRRGATFIKLKDGRVLAAGGARGAPDGNRFLTSAEIYDPATGLWTYTGNMQMGREGLISVRLQDGRVLVAGGEGPWFTPNSKSEVYDPISGNWSNLTSMPWGWGSANFTLLLDGRVLLTGGFSYNQVVPYAAIYDPTTSIWTSVKSMNSPRGAHSSLLLKDGRVLVIGGSNGVIQISTTEIYDPIANSWTNGPGLNDAQTGASLLHLANGEVLLVGGGNNTSLVNYVQLLTTDVTVIDTTPPVIKCDSVDTLWHSSDVVISCSASDEGSGLANPAEASLTLATVVPADTETANAATGTKQICDKKGNCALAGPVTGIKVDKKGPSISVSSPISGTILVVGQTVKVSYTCSDDGSGMNKCEGPVANGGNLDTATAGFKSFNVTATDLVGNSSSQSVSYTVAVQSCEHPALSQLSDYALLDLTKGRRDAAAGLANLLDVSPPGNGTADSTYWRWVNTPKAVALQLDLGAAKTVNMLKLFTQAPTKAPNTYFQYSQDGQLWSDIPGLSSVNAGESYGMKSYPVDNITARYFRVVIDNTTYLNDIGYFSDLQVCSLSVNGQPVGQPTPPQANSVAHRLPISTATASKGSAGAVLDNNSSTAWVADGKPTSAWLQLDLGTKRMVSGLNYYVTSSAVALHTRIEYSSDGTSWTTLTGASDLNTGAAYGAKSFGPFAPVTARYIRFTITNPENNWALGGYGEVDVVGYPIS